MYKSKYKNANATEIPTIVIDSPSKSELGHIDEETSLMNDEKSKLDNNANDRKNSLRRNSISLPNLDDLNVLKQRVQVIFHVLANIYE